MNDILIFAISTGLISILFLLNITFYNIEKVLILFLTFTVVIFNIFNSGYMLTSFYITAASLFFLVYSYCRRINYKKNRTTPLIKNVKVETKTQFLFCVTSIILFFSFMACLTIIPENTNNIAIIFSLLFSIIVLSFSLHIGKLKHFTIQYFKEEANIFSSILSYTSGFVSVPVVICGIMGNYDYFMFSFAVALLPLILFSILISILYEYHIDDLTIEETRIKNKNNKQDKTYKSIVSESSCGSTETIWNNQTSSECGNHVHATKPNLIKSKNKIKKKPKIFNF